MIIEIIAGAAFVGLVAYGLIGTHQKKQNQMVIEKAKTELSPYGHVETKDKMLLFTTKNKTYEVLFYRVGLHSELTINSKAIWEIKDASSSRLINQLGFLSGKYPKIVVVFPTTVVVKRYINENELEFVKFNKPFNDMYIVRHFELSSLLNEGIL